MKTISFAVFAYVAETVNLRYNNIISQAALFENKIQIS